VNAITLVGKLPVITGKTACNWRRAVLSADAGLLVNIYVHDGQKQFFDLRRLTGALQQGVIVYAGSTFFNFLLTSVRYHVYDDLLCFGCNHSSSRVTCRLFQFPANKMAR